MSTLSSKNMNAKVFQYVTAMLIIPLNPPRGLWAYFERPLAVNEHIKEAFKMARYCGRQHSDAPRELAVR